MSLAGEALQRQAPAVWFDAATDPRINREMLRAWSIKSVLAVPIRVSEKVLGVALLSTSSDYRHFTPDEIELVWGIANSVALAVDNARRMKRRAGGWPHLFKKGNNDWTISDAKIETSKYYDVVNFARRVTAKGLYAWGWNDETCPPPRCTRPTTSCARAGI